MAWDPIGLSKLSMPEADPRGVQGLNHCWAQPQKNVYVIYLNLEMKWKFGIFLTWGVTRRVREILGPPLHAPLFENPGSGPAITFVLLYHYSVLAWLQTKHAK
jgi:hypothetical protein